MGHARRFFSLVVIVGLLPLLIACSGSLVNTGDLVPITAQNAPLIRELALLPEYTDWIHSIDLSPDGKTLALGSEDATVRLWRANSGKQAHSLRAHQGAVQEVAFSPDGTVVASAGVDGQVLLWDAKAGKGLAALETSTSGMTVANSVDFSPDGRTLALGTGQHNPYGGMSYVSIQLWDLATATQAAVIELDQPVVKVLFSPDGSLLATGHSDGILRLWDVSGTMIGERAKLVEHRANTRGLTFSPDGRLLASGDNEGEIRLWDVASGAMLLGWVGHEHWVMSLAFSPDGSVLASGSRDGMVKLWDVQSGANLSSTKVIPATYEGRDIEDWVTDLAFNAQGTLLFVAVGHLGDSTVRLWGIPGS